MNVDRCRYEDDGDDGDDGDHGKNIGCVDALIAVDVETDGGGRK